MCRGWAISYSTKERKRPAANECKQMSGKEVHELPLRDRVTGTMAAHNELTMPWLKLSEMLTWKTDFIFHRAVEADRIFMNQASRQINI